MNILFGILLFVIVIYFLNKDVKEPYFQVPNQLQQINLSNPIAMKKNDINHMYAYFYNDPVLDTTKNEMDMLSINALKQILKETKDKINEHEHETTFNHNKAVSVSEDNDVYDRMVHGILTHMTNTTLKLGLKKVVGETWEYNKNKYRDIIFTVEIEHPYNKLYKNANMVVNIKFVVLNNYVVQLVLI